MDFALIIFVFILLFFNTSHARNKNRQRIEEVKEWMPCAFQYLETHQFSILGELFPYFNAVWWWHILMGMGSALISLSGFSQRQCCHPKAHFCAPGYWHYCYELGLNKDRYKSLADEMDSTFAELAGY